MTGKLVIYILLQLVGSKLSNIIKRYLINIDNIIGGALSKSVQEKFFPGYLHQ